LKRRANLVGATDFCRAVEFAVLALHQGRVRPGAIGAIKRNQSGKRAVCRDFEYRAVAVRVRTTGLCRAIEGVVTAGLAPLLVLSNEINVASVPERVNWNSEP
jgi:hypothetical protein